MKRLCGLVFTFVFSALAAFSPASHADSVTKTFNATFPVTIKAGNPVTFSVTFYNTTPGVATINSIKVYPAPGVTFVSPYTTQYSATLVGGGALVITNFPGIKSQKNAAFTFYASVAGDCSTPSTWPQPLANAGNSLQGDNFNWNGNNSQLTSNLGCDGLVSCGGSINASVNGATSNDPGYALITVGTTLKNGDACTGPMGYAIQNLLLGQNKLVVTLTNSNAAYTTQINSGDLPVDASGYASERVKVAWDKNTDGSWKYIQAPTCLCTSALSSCMPIDTVSTDPYFNTQVKACAVDYTWVTSPTPGFARYFATIIGVGNDPAMGWGD